MNDAKTFIDFINKKNDTVNNSRSNISYKYELTESEEAEIDLAIDKFVKEYLDKGNTIDGLNESVLNEGTIGAILGGLAGFAFGKSLGKIVARVLGVEKGLLYEMLTSRLVGMALGAAIGRGTPAEPKKKA